MNAKLKSARVLLPLLVIALGGLLWSLIRQDEGGFEVARDVNKPPRYLADNAILTRYDEDGLRTLYGTARQVEYFDDESAKAQVLDATTYTDNQGVWNVTAPSAFLPAKSRRILLQGEVVARGTWPDSRLPLTVTTSELWVDTVAHTLSTDAKVTLDSEGRDGSATGLRAEWIAKRLELLHNVKMRYDRKP